MVFMGTAGAACAEAPLTSAGSSNTGTREIKIALTVVFIAYLTFPF
jgi:hypothetical protein